MTSPAPDITILPSLACLGVVALLAAPLPAGANPAEIESGRKLVKETKCEVCHAKKTGGDGTGIYTRADRKVSTLAKLTAQVARCNSELNLSLFPEDEAAIVTFLNVTYYTFK